MTLSQIIARCSEADVEIPDMGKWKVYLVINDGSLFHQDVTHSKDWSILKDQRKEKGGIK